MVVQRHGSTLSQIHVSACHGRSTSGLQTRAEHDGLYHGGEAMLELRFLGKDVRDGKEL